MNSKSRPSGYGQSRTQPPIEALRAVVVRDERRRGVGLPDGVLIPERSAMRSTMRDNITTPDVRDGVRRLVEVLNQRILSAADANEAGHWWSPKIEAKRKLAVVPQSDSPRVAARILHELEREAAAA